MPIFSEHVKRTIRQCWGLDAHNASKDGDLEQVSQMRAFSYMCQWYLGDDRWAIDFLDWLDGCGFEVKEKTNVEVK